jgi:hypothetical protein
MRDWFRRSYLHGWSHGYDMKSVGCSSQRIMKVCNASSCLHEEQEMEAQNGSKSVRQEMDSATALPRGDRHIAKFVSLASTSFSHSYKSGE